MSLQDFTRIVFIVATLIGIIAPMFPLAPALRLWLRARSLPGYRAEQITLLRFVGVSLSMIGLDVVWFFIFFLPFVSGRTISEFPLAVIVMGIAYAAIKVIGVASLWSLFNSMTSGEGEGGSTGLLTPLPQIPPELVENQQE